MTPRESEKRDLVQEGKDLSNTLRNEQQKRVLLAELGKSRRDEVAKQVEMTKQRIEECTRSIKKEK